MVPISDGTATGDLGLVSGINSSGCDLGGMSFDYIGENQWIDRIGPAPASVSILSNTSPAFDIAVFRDSGGYRTVGASFELASTLVTGKLTTLKAHPFSLSPRRF